MGHRPGRGPLRSIDWSTVSLISISLRTVVGALVVSTALTACGGPVKAGAAATFGCGRITTASLDQTAIDWKKQHDKNPAADQTRQSLLRHPTPRPSPHPHPPPPHPLP